MLAGREHSVAELRRKLTQSGLRGKRSGRSVDITAAEVTAVHMSQLVEDVLTGLQEDNLLSDERCAEVLVTSLINRGYGPHKLQQESRKRSIDFSLLQTAIDARDVDWSAQASAALSRRYAGFADDRATWEKAGRFLQRRGFGSKTILDALGEPPG